MPWGAGASQQASELQTHMVMTKVGNFAVDPSQVTSKGAEASVNGDALAQVGKFKGWSDPKRFSRGAGVTAMVGVTRGAMLAMATAKALRVLVKGF